jgi:hypothetical protein
LRGTALCFLFGNFCNAQTKKKMMHDKLNAAINSLNLSDDQKAKLQAMFADAETKGDAVRVDTT